MKKVLNLSLIIMSSFSLVACFPTVDQVPGQSSLSADKQATASKTGTATSDSDDSLPDKSLPAAESGDAVNSGDSPSVSDSSSTDSPSTTPAASAEDDPNLAKVDNLHVDIKNRFMRGSGSTSDIIVRFRDKEMNFIELKSPELKFSLEQNGNPFKIDEKTGLITALSSDGTAQVVVELIGTSVTAKQNISVDSPGGGGGGGGGGSAAAASSSTSTVDSVSGTITFEL